MILILSTETDRSTEHVIRWLRFLGAKFIRLNDQDFLDFSSSIFLSGSYEASFKIKKAGQINLRDVTCYWYRRGNFSFQFPEYFKLQRLEQRQEKVFVLSTEYKKFWEFVHYSLRFTNHIGGFSDNELNKLGILMTAQKVGLSIPNTLITNKKSEVLAFLADNKRIITKGIENTMSFADHGKWYHTYTSLMT